MTTEWPKISLVTAVYNGEMYLAETLASIRSQNYPNLEYIVYDGGSTDGTLQILEQNRDLISILVSEKDQGMYDALYKGFARATGEIFGWIGADDLLMPWCLRTVAKYFIKNRGCQWVTGIPTKFDGNGNMIWVNPITPHYRRSWIRRRWYSSFGLGVIQQESTYFKRDLYEKAGGLQTCMRFKIAGDFDLWCRFAEHAELRQLGVYIAGYRFHGANAGAAFDNYIKEGRLVKIPCGLALGDFYSIASMIMSKLHRRGVDNC